MKSTTDIWFSSFLMLHGYTVSDFEVIDKNRGKFFFTMSDEDWKAMRLRFNKSDVSKVKHHQTALKDLIH